MQELFKKLATDIVRKQSRRRSTQQNQLALWIGRIAIAFNELEAALSEAIAAELGHGQKPVQDVVQASMGFGQKLDMFSALLLDRFRDDESHLTYIHTVLASLSAAEECRNVVLHSAWTTHPFFSIGYERRKVRTKGRKGLKVDQAAANIAGLRAAASDIQVLRTIAMGVARHPQAAARYNQQAFQQATERLRTACLPPLRSKDSLRALTMLRGQPFPN